ncbi:hypothetical protein SAMN02745203_00829 [Porphyromonas crevioricanis]|nr:hypothetical protein SAMN02745203_00829 [Porphyromonas crevioricanis]
MRLRRSLNLALKKNRNRQRNNPNLHNPKTLHHLCGVQSNRERLIGSQT